MKKIKYNFLLLLILAELFNASTLRAKVSDPKKQNLRIQHFIQIWGLVKYKSEKSIAGKFDADNEFLSLIDSVKNAEENQFQQMMLKLVGPIATTSTSFSYRDQKKQHRLFAEKY